MPEMAHLPMSFLLSLIVSINALGVSAPIEPLSLVNGHLTEPTSGDVLGAYQLPGNLVLVGHVDWQYKPGVFYRLGSLVPGDEITISDGRAYSVAWTSTTTADDIGDTYATGSDDLTLITCGGSFSASMQAYAERVVVRAVKVRRD
jgi:sortase (surface protein transpeptidase)